jgi:hypothetical protein
MSILFGLAPLPTRTIIEHRPLSHPANELGVPVLFILLLSFQEKARHPDVLS